MLKEMDLLSDYGYLPTLSVTVTLPLLNSRLIVSWTLLKSSKSLLIMFCNSTRFNTDIAVTNDTAQAMRPNLIEQLLRNLEMAHKDVHFLAAGTQHQVFAFQWLHDGVIEPAVVRVTIDAPKQICKATHSLSVILTSLQDHLSYMPRLIYFDATPNKILQTSFTIQTRKPGEPLCKVWRSLSLKAKCNIAEDIAEFLLSCESIHYSRYGFLNGAIDAEQSIGRLAIIR